MRLAMRMLGLRSPPAGPTQSKWDLHPYLAFGNQIADEAARLAAKKCQVSAWDAAPYLAVRAKAKDVQLRLLAILWRIVTRFGKRECDTQ